jgi:hypothetical protein
MVGRRGLLFFALFSMLISMGAPGLGWVIAAFNLLLAGLFIPLIGRRCLGLCLVITIAHLFTFGPMSGAQSSFKTSPLFSAGFVLLPLAVAGCLLLMPVWRAHRRRHAGKDGKSAK